MIPTTQSSVLSCLIQGGSISPVIVQLVGWVVLTEWNSRQLCQYGYGCLRVSRRKQRDRDHLDFVRVIHAEMIPSVTSKLGSWTRSLVIESNAQSGSEIRTSSTFTYQKNAFPQMRLLCDFPRFHKYSFASRRKRSSSKRTRDDRPWETLHLLHVRLQHGMCRFSQEFSLVQGGM